MIRLMLTATASSMLLVGSWTPVLAKAHDQPSSVAQKLGQAVADGLEGHAENVDARGLLDGLKGIEDPKDSGQRGNVEPAAGGRFGKGQDNSGRGVGRDKTDHGGR